jgi:hypothetical protein
VSTPAQEMQELAAQLRAQAKLLQDPRQPPAVKRDVASQLQRIGAALEILSRNPPYRDPIGD